MSSDYSGSSNVLLRLHMAVDKPLIPSFFLLLQQGVVIRCGVGRSIAAFLREEIGATAETIDTIQSIMLDGRPVDDLETARIKDGSTLALSAAMPGLVGATLRRGGAYSSFRSAITHHETAEASSPGEGSVHVKIFNLLMSALGPGLLYRGIILGAREIAGFISGQSPNFWEGCRSITLDGKPVDAGKLRDPAWLTGNEHILLTVASV